MTRTQAIGCAGLVAAVFTAFSVFFPAYAAVFPGLATAVTAFLPSVLVDGPDEGNVP